MLTHEVARLTAGFRHTYFAILEEENGLPAYKKGVTLPAPLTLNCSLLPIPLNYFRLRQGNSPQVRSSYVN